MTTTEPTFRTALVFGGRHDGTKLRCFDEGDWLAGANGWPLVLNGNCEPVLLGQQSGDQRYVQKIKNTYGELSLVYVWEPALAGWLLGQGTA